MKLPKKDIARLRGILNDMERAEKFLLKPETILAQETTLTGAKETVWINPETGKQALSFNKHVGSNLCYLNNAIRGLNNFLNVSQ